MALIKCTECKKKFSSRAPACPRCGCPTEDVLKDLGIYDEMLKNESEAPEEENVSEEKDSRDELVSAREEIIVTANKKKRNK